MKDVFIQAFKKGNAITRLSAIILGLGNLAGELMGCTTVVLKEPLADESR